MVAVTAPFPGLTIQLLPAPVLTGVSGCQGSGNATLRCVPDSDVLRLQGTGLLSLAQTFVNVDLNRAYEMDAAAFARVAPHTSVPVPFLSVLSDSEAELDLASVYGLALQVELFGSGEVPLTLLLGALLYSSSVYQTNAVYVSFAPLSPPTVSALGVVGSAALSMDPSRGCQAVGNSSMRLQGCDGGFSLLQLTGHYLSSPSVSVGGQLCAMPYADYWQQQPDATQTRWCVLPPFPGPASTFYDLVVTTVAGQLTLPQAVSFTDQPVLTSVLSCSDDAWFSQYLPITQPGTFHPRCFAGSTLYLTGLNLLPATTPFTVTLSGPQSPLIRFPVTANCLQPTYLNATTLSCVLPSPPAGLNSGGGTVLIQIRYPSANATSNWLTTSTIYDQPTSPRVTSVQGCTGIASPAASPLAVGGCQWGSSLTIIGSFLLGNTSLPLSGPSLASYPNWGMSLSKAQLSSDRVVLTLTLQALYSLPNLPVSDADLMGGNTYQVSLYFSQAPYMLTSNAFSITFAPSLPDPVGPASTAEGGAGDTGSRSSTVVVAVLVPVVVLVLAGVALQLRRRRRQMMASKPTSSVHQQQEPTAHLNTRTPLSDADDYSIEMR